MRPYDQYLLSEEWAQKRARVLRLANYKCDVCSKPETLEVHHLTYKRIGREETTDLVALCKKCHKQWDRYRKTHKGYFDHLAHWFYEVGENWRSKYSINEAVQEFEKYKPYSLGLNKR